MGKFIAGNPQQSLGAHGLARQGSQETQYDSYWRHQAREEAKLFGSLHPVHVEVPVQEPPSLPQEPVHEPKPEEPVHEPKPEEPVHEPKPEEPVHERKPDKPVHERKPEAPLGERKPDGEGGIPKVEEVQENGSGSDDDISLGHSVSERTSSKSSKFDKYYYRFLVYIPLVLITMPTAGPCPPDAKATPLRGC